MATFQNLPGVLNLSAKSSDGLLTSLDFDQSAVGVTVVAEMVSVVTGLTATGVTAAVSDDAGGVVSVGLTPNATAGTYKWRHYWTYPSGARRTMVEGFLEVKP
jgi:hypothetical protein